MGVGDQYMTDPARSQRLFQGRDMVRQIRAGIDHRNRTPRPHDMDAGASERERARIGCKQPRYQRRKLDLLSWSHIQRAVKVHLSLTRKIRPDTRAAPVR